jgi:hypothetical protein
MNEVPTLPIAITEGIEIDTMRHPVTCSVGVGAWKLKGYPLTPETAATRAMAKSFFKKLKRSYRREGMITVA